MWSIEILRPLRVAIALPVPAQNCFYLPGPSSSHGHSEWNLLTASTATVSSHIIWIHGNWVLFCKYKAIFCVYLTPMDQLLNFANNDDLFHSCPIFFVSVKQGNLGNVTELKMNSELVEAGGQTGSKPLAKFLLLSHMIWTCTPKTFYSRELFLLCSTLTKWYDNNRNRKTVHTFCFCACLSYSAKTR